VISTQHRALTAGYRMPAEWEPHAATYLVWPHNRDTWPGTFERIPPVFAQLAAAIARFEPLRILVEDAAAQAAAQPLIDAELRRSGVVVPGDRLRFVEVQTDDSWIRDHGPIFINRRGGGAGPAQLALDWRFNSWGEKYGPWARDDVVPRELGRRFGFEVIEPGIVLEGGSIEVNGAGLILTTEQCLLNPNRNPALTRGEIEDYLTTYLGGAKVLWLGEGIAGDDTDGHIDDLARFVSADTIVTVVEHDPADENYRPLADNLRRLRAMRDLDGRPFTIATLPMPPAMHHEGTRMPASYANFYIANGAVVMPHFDCARDAEAAEVLRRLFPGRQVVGVPAIDLVWGLGTIHCLTQQHPQP
jgi:agmatine deiminase